MTRVLPLKRTAWHSTWIKSEKQANLQVSAFILGDWLSLGHLWRSASKMDSLSKFRPDPLFLGDKNMKRVGSTCGKGWGAPAGPQGGLCCSGGPWSRHTATSPRPSEKGRRDQQETMKATEKKNGSLKIKR